MRSLATKMEKLEDRMGTVEDKIETVDTKVEESVELVGVVKSRQQTLMSEVRLISHFKVTAQSHVRHDGHDSDLAVDGHFLFSRGTPETDISCFLGEPRKQTISK